MVWLKLTKNNIGAISDEGNNIGTIYYIKTDMQVLRRYELRLRSRHSLCGYDLSITDKTLKI